MKHYLINDFGTIVTCDTCADIANALGYNSNAEMIEENGGVMPDVYELTEYEYTWYKKYGEYDIV